MRAAEAAEPQITVIFTRQRGAAVARGRGGWDGLAHGSADTDTRRAVAVLAGEIAETEVVPWAGTGDADR